jgi:hypothetical protein
MRPPSVCGRATEPLIPLLLHLPADLELFLCQSDPFSFRFEVDSDAGNILGLFFFTSGRIKIKHSVDVHNYWLFVML